MQDSTEPTSADVAVAMRHRAERAESALREILITIELTARDSSAGKTAVVSRVADVLRRYDMFAELREGGSHGE